MSRAEWIRTRIKRALIAGHCSGWFPAWVVTLAFRLFRLRAS